jgi:uncharacterized protein
MKLEGEQTLLRVHLSNFTKWHSQPLYEALVERARRRHLSGATVLKGLWGYFGTGPILGGHPNAFQVEQPVVIEMVDSAEKLEGFLEEAREMLLGKPVLVTMERAHVIHYRAGERGKGEVGA